MTPLTTSQMRNLRLREVKPLARVTQPESGRAEC